MDKTALIFPGQGSQQVGMGRDLALAYAEVRDLYAVADQVVGFSLSNLCFEGPEDALNDTVNTQPALFITCLAVLKAMQMERALPKPALVAGHSLGELTALVAAGAMDLADGLRLVRERSRLMKLAGERRPGGMAAVLKMEDQDVERACKEASAETGQPVQVANYNTPGQVVISGDGVALQKAVQLLRAWGAKRVVPLAVSIAAHSPLMASVAEEYRQAVEATPMRPPLVSIVGNISARPLASVGEIRDELAGQLTWPVHWTASVQWMAARGVTRFIEVGPKDVLRKLVQRIVPDAEVISVGDLPTVRGLERDGL